MYHVAGTGLTALILYLLSYLLYRNSFYSLQFHRRIWNMILAFSFLATALAGVFLALQITYKWNLPFVKSILTLHVECGIGLAFTGIVHFLWHIRYFTGRFRKDPGSLDLKASPPGINGSLAPNLFVVGFLSTSVQLLLLKEIINITGGYELIAGTFLASWLAGSAAGSAIASNSPMSDIRKINLFFSLGPVISISLLLLLSGIYLKPGETPSFLAGIIYTLVVLLPFCLITGFTFARLASHAQVAGTGVPGRSFSVETSGGIAAGIVVSIFGAGKINTWELLTILIVLGISYTLLAFYASDRKTGIILRVAALAAVVLVILFPPDIAVRQLLLKGIRVTASTDTPYGNITRGKYGNEESTYYNQRLISYGNDVSEREEDIHYAMLQPDNPATVLIVSGDAASRVKEIAKYPVRKIVYVERDPGLIGPAKIAGLPPGIDFRTENDDAFTFIRGTNEKFDAVIDLLPPPSSLLINRYLTYEFFSAVKSRMNADGVFSCSPGINPDYFNREGIKYYSSVYNTLKAVFRNVIPVSGTKLYYIASDKELSPEICRLVRLRNIANSYVGPDYLSDDLITAKTAEVTAQLDGNARINHTLLPVACFYYQSFEMTKDIPEKMPAVALLAILFVLPGLGVRRRNLTMYFCALSLAGFEIILLLMLQTAAGNMFEVTGLIISGIMAGLAIGSWIRLPVNPGKLLKWDLTALVLIYLAAAFSFPVMAGMHSRSLAVTVLIVAGFLPAAATGQVFRQMTSGGTGAGEAPVIYSSDLIGSAAGFIIFSGLLVPLLGIRNAILLLPVLVLAAFLTAPSAKREGN